jgi:cell division protein FtsZ
MDNTDFENISFDLPKNQSNVIKVIGVGGGGSNAVNHMFNKGINGVDFIVCNTDAQALKNSPVPTKIQLGASLTEGLGAGANPEVGEQSALENKEDIYAMLGGKTKMVFITVGMGGGTGTGAAPVIAQMAREMNLLTIGIVTTPFSFEGKNRNEQAQKGIEKLRQQVDSLIVINNNKLREVYGNLGFKSGFSKADEVLSTAASGIAEVITHHYTQNIDLKDANTVLSNSGSAIMGSSTASGSNRAQEAITKALDSPLLNDNKITGAKNVLLLIVSGSIEITIDEIGEINDYIQSEAKCNVNIIMGVGEDESLGDSIAVTIVATGFNKEQQSEISIIENKKIIYNLDDSTKKETTVISKKSTSKTDTQTDAIQNILDKPVIVHQLDETDTKSDNQISINLFDIDVNEAEFITQKSIDVKDDEKTGFLDTEFLMDLSAAKQALNDKASIKTDDFELIPTTEIIKNIEVVYDDVLAHENDFIITTAINDIEVIDPEYIKVDDDENQMTFVFDLPIDSNKEFEERSIEDIQIKADLEEAKQIDVIDTEIVSQDKVYHLDEYLELENTLNDAEPEKIDSSIVLDLEELSPKLKIEAKIVTEKETIDEFVEIKSKKDVSPLNSTITELKSRAEERRSKMKAFNYKFTNNVNQNIDELENQPAYKRKNIELDDTNADSNQSRTSLDVDGNEINFRSNNSFLHDNVD